MYTTNNFEDYLIEGKLNIDRIIEDYTPYVKKIIDNMSGNILPNEDKEEILADTFFILWKNQKNIMVSLSSYIAGITRNLIKEKIRNLQINYDITDFENIIDISSKNLFDDERDEIIKIEKAIGALRELDNKIINLFYYSSMSIKDIAKELKLSEFNVKTRLYRIRKKIKTNLNKGE